MPSRSPKPIRLLIADDHELLRQGFHTILKKRTDIELVGEATNGIELVELTEKLQPDVIISDIKMPKMEGIEATRIIVQKHPAIGIIAFTVFEDELLIVEMLEAGAQGYLLKNASQEEVIEAIHAVFDQNTYYCRQTTAQLAKVIAKGRFNLNKKILQTTFNEKETTIIKLICEEFQTKDIATKLNCSVRTIEGYREKIEEKMKVKNTAGIVVYAIKKGIYKI